MCYLRQRGDSELPSCSGASPNLAADDALPSFPTDGRPPLDTETRRRPLHPSPSSRVTEP
ncbi:Protein of unknown function [Gryllus bimaculatus]|nr:Protein of unknown function [Gryllus bimaculatus]